MRSWLMEIWRLATCGDGLHRSGNSDSRAACVVLRSAALSGSDKRRNARNGGEGTACVRRRSGSDRRKMDRRTDGESGRLGVRSRLIIGSSTAVRGGARPSLFGITVERCRAGAHHLPPSPRPLSSSLSISPRLITFASSVRAAWSPPPRANVWRNLSPRARKLDETERPKSCIVRPAGRLTSVRDRRRSLSAVCFRPL